MMIFFLTLTMLMLLVMYFDITRYIIPNWLNALVLALYLPFAFLADGVDWQQALIAFAVIFAVGYAMFMLRLMGGGDVKLFVALAPWTGTSALLPFLLLVAVLGGVLTIFLLIARKWAPVLYVRKNNKPLPRILQDKAPVPYGIAISAGFLYLLWKMQLPGLSF